MRLGNTYFDHFKGGVPYHQVIIQFQANFLELVCHYRNFGSKCYLNAFLSLSVSLEHARNETLKGL